MKQALCVRPFEGQVLFAAGQDALLAGDAEKAVGYWKSAYEAGPSQRAKLLNLLAGRVPVDFILETFPLDGAALRQLRSRYQELEDDRAFWLTRQRQARLAEEEAVDSPGRDSAAKWLEVARRYKNLDNIPERLRCLHNAVRNDPANYDARYALGQCLYTMKRPHEAEEHLTWCLRQQPQDQQLRRLVEAVLDQRLRSGAEPRAARDSAAPARR